LFRGREGDLSVGVGLLGCKVVCVDLQVRRYKRFGGIYCFIFRAEVTMKTACFSETLVSAYNSMWRHNLQSNFSIFTTIRTSNLQEFFCINVIKSDVNLVTYPQVREGISPAVAAQSVKLITPPPNADAYNV
jgi:hypothetical protein